MKRIFVFLLLSLLMINPSFASSKQEKAKELLKLMNTDAIFDSVYELVMVPVFCTVVMPLEEQKSFRDEFIKIMDLDSFFNIAIDFWINNFTEEEMDDLYKAMWIEFEKIKEKENTEVINNEEAINPNPYPQNYTDLLNEEGPKEEKIFLTIAGITVLVFSLLARKAVKSGFLIK